jgi:hypothetical protein
MKQKETRARRPYEKPEIRRIELRPEEALSVGCKTLGGTECNSGDCVANPAPCFVTYGS